MRVDTERAIADLRTLAGFGKFGEGVNRRALTPDDLAARSWLKERMQAAGLETLIDGIGNVIGTTPGCKRYIIIASHTDTVPKGGWLDGAMGVIFGLEIARSLVEAGGGDDTGIKVISFNDEEGRFAGLLGSSVFCGLKTPEQAFALSADDGTTLDSALQTAGYGGHPIMTLDTDRDSVYLEAHIEQGPVLENNDRKIGVVTEIVGVARGMVSFHGQADHAGTTPMAIRKDAAAALYEFAVRFEEFCRSQYGDLAVWNLGQARLDPGACNVVAREAALHLEYRSSSDEALKRIDEVIPELAAEVASGRRVEHRFSPGVRTVPALMDKDLVGRIRAAAERRAAPAMCMPSGAGHDAMLFAPKIPTAMLFVPSIGGRSHDVSEDTREQDISLGLEVLGEVVADIIENGLIENDLPGAKE